MDLKIQSNSGQLNTFSAKTSDMEVVKLGPWRSYKLHGGRTDDKEAGDRSRERYRSLYDFPAN